MKNKYESHLLDSTLLNHKFHNHLFRCRVIAMMMPGLGLQAYLIISCRASSRLFHNTVSFCM